MNDSLLDASAIPADTESAKNLSLSSGHIDVAIQCALDADELRKITTSPMDESLYSNHLIASLLSELDRHKSENSELRSLCHPLLTPRNR